jgi:multidrug efflux pump subunit AcrB
MNLIVAALRRPITVMVAVLAVTFFSVLAISKMPIDIFPKLGLPTIYVAQPYGGLSPDQMEGFISSYYEYHFLYVTGIKYVESKSIQGVSLIKLQFHPGTDMDQAIAEVIAYVNRARAFMPPNTVSPFVVRFDAGSVPVGQLVFSSDSRSLSEIQDLALFKVRPMFASLQGVSAPPPFGGNQRTVVIRVDPERLRSYHLSLQDVVKAVAKGNYISPAGNVRIGDLNYLTPTNAVVENIQDLNKIPLKTGAGPTVFIRDFAKVENAADITTGYALINGKRAVYIPVTKRSDASTWDVVQRIKQALPSMQSAIPADIKISYEFDQSGYVINSLKNLLAEGALGAILTGLMVLLFLGDKRSALIVVLTIPFALLSAMVALSLTGQTINIMTLGGLALSVGILVDEATVTMENIHRHLEMKKPKGKAISDACREIAFPKLLILLSILSMFVPALFMSGVPQAMFFPLSIAVGFAMIASFLLSQTFVPVIANWILKEADERKDQRTEKHSRFSFDQFKQKYERVLDRLFKIAGTAIVIYLLSFFFILGLSFYFIGSEIFPRVDTGQFQMRIRTKTGTRIERTEEATIKALQTLETMVGKNNIDISSAFIGVQPSSYPINTIYLWTSGPQEAVLLVKLKKGSGFHLEDLKEKIRAEFRKKIPGITISFEPADLVDRVMSLGSNTPIDIAVYGKSFPDSRKFAERIKSKLLEIPYLRDIQYGIPLEYPSIKIDIDRERAGQLGLTVEDISNSITEATSSSRFTQPVYWLDSKTGTAYQVQVEVPPSLIKSAGDIENVELKSFGDIPIALRDVAVISHVSSPAETDRYNMQRMINVIANIHGEDLGKATKEINAAIASLGKIPEGMQVSIRGKSDLLKETHSELQSGLFIAVVVIFLLLTANFQSFKLSFAVLSTLPAVLAGSLFFLLITGKTLDIQSFMGIIMALGVSIANAILFATYAEKSRKASGDAEKAGRDAADKRFRPILMTALAMIAGMLPMASGIGEGGAQIAPLGIAVIGGLLFSTFSTLLILPLIYSRVQKTIKRNAVSLDPEDPESIYQNKEPTIL